jgi:hypothetical protein
MILNIIANLEKGLLVFKDRSPNITPKGLMIHVNIQMVPRELKELGMAITHDAIPIKMAINERLRNTTDFNKVTPYYIIFTRFWKQKK